MPFNNPFRSKKKEKVNHTNTSGAEVAPKPQTTPNPSNGGTSGDPTRLTFHAQLAHGSPTAKLNAFSNLKELYVSIAAAFNIPFAEIIFCTLNTHKCDMERLLGGQIGLEDFIFAHVKGEKKECNIVKSESTLGLTITDNGNGYPFVKRIREGSIADQIPDIQVGDMIQQIGMKGTIGMRHFQVARMLRDIAENTTFTMTLIEPKKAFDMISQRPASKAPTTASAQSLGTGKATLRLRSSGQATIEALPTPLEEKAVGRIDDLLESFMGIRDIELSSTIWDCGKDKLNPDSFLQALGESQLGDFGFPQEFVFDVWGVVLDCRSASK